MYEVSPSSLILRRWQWEKFPQEPRRQASCIPSSYAMQNTFLRGCARGSHRLWNRTTQIRELAPTEIRKQEDTEIIILTKADCIYIYIYILIYTTNIYKCTELVRRGCKPANTLSDFPIPSSGLLRITNQALVKSTASREREDFNQIVCLLGVAAYGSNGGTPL